MNCKHALVASAIITTSRSFGKVSFKFLKNNACLSLLANFFSGYISSYTVIQTLAIFLEPFTLRSVRSARLEGSFVIYQDYVELQTLINTNLPFETPAMLAPQGERSLG